MNRMINIHITSTLLLQQSETGFETLEPLFDLWFEQRRGPGRIRSRHLRVSELPLQSCEHVERVFANVRFRDSPLLGLK